MSFEALVVPLSAKHNIYALRDERGNIMGTGTREVCEVLLYIIARSKEAGVKIPIGVMPLRPNLRAAIAI